MKLKALLTAGLVSAAGLIVATPASAYTASNVSVFLMDSDASDVMGSVYLVLCDAEVNGDDVDVTCYDSPN